MSTNNPNALHPLVCPSCSAPLEAAQLNASLITCAHCGTHFEKPKPQNPPGAVVAAGPGSIAIGGNVTGNITLTVVHAQADNGPTSSAAAPA